MDHSGKKYPHITNLRILESKAKVVASIDACQWTYFSINSSKEVPWSGIGREKDGDRSLSLPFFNSANRGEKRSYMIEEDVVISKYPLDSGWRKNYWVCLPFRKRWVLSSEIEVMEWRWHDSNWFEPMWIVKDLSLLKNNILLLLGLACTSKALGT